MNDVLIDASNLRVGGGVQVAASFIDELIRMSTEQRALEQHPWMTSMRVEASSTVIQNLRENVSGLSGRIHTVDRSWRNIIVNRWASPRSDVRFTIFGPFFGSAKTGKHIIGFADVAIVYPRPARLPDVSRLTGLKKRIRARLACRSFRSAHKLVVETEAVRDRVSRVLAYPSERIDVVPNAINGVFLHRGAWQEFELRLPKSSDLVLAYVTRAYPHKNMGFLGELAEELSANHGLSISYVLTLDESEWQGLDQSTKDHSINIGLQPIASVPSVLAQTDGVIFPSLLEAYSASPIEAMALGLPLYASDRDFVRSVCGDYPIYFDPEDPVSAAARIASDFGDGKTKKVQVPKPAVLSWTARDRAEAYALIVEEAIG